MLILRIYTRLFEFLLLTKIICQKFSFLETIIDLVKIKTIYKKLLLINTSLKVFDKQFFNDLFNIDYLFVFNRLFVFDYLFVFNCLFVVDYLFDVDCSSIFIYFFESSNVIFLINLLLLMINVTLIFFSLITLLLSDFNMIKILIYVLFFL